VAVRILALALVVPQVVPGGESVFHGDFEHELILQGNDAGAENTCLSGMLYSMIYSKERKDGENLQARVFMSGRSQAVRIPVEFRFTAEEVYVRRDPQSGDLILSQAPGGWDEIFAALDAAGIPEDFLADRKQGPPQERPDL